MRTIETNKSIGFENLLSLRKKMTQEEANDEIVKIGQVLKERNVKKNGPLITATFNVEMINNEQVIDMEILVPIDRKIELPKEYTLKKEFHLVNAVYARHIGNPNDVQNTYNEINNFIMENKLQPITTGYNVTVKDINDARSINEVVIDIYIGINPCVL